MNDWLQHIRHFSSTHPWLPIGGAALGVAVVATLVWLGVRTARGAGRDRLISTLINIAALMATAVQASGMWKFFGATMGLPVGFRIFMFSFMEIALLACGLRARANVEEGGDAGIDGVLVWVLAIASGLMSSTEANSPQEALMRVLTSVVVALLWTRDLMAAKQGARKAGGLGKPAEKIRWRLGVSAIAVKLRLADATDHGLADRDANRRIDAFVMAAHTANTVPEGTRSGERAHRRRARAHAKLMRHARLHADPTHLMNLLGQAAFAEALDLLGIEGSVPQDAGSGAVDGTRRGDRHTGDAEARRPLPGAERLAATLAQAEREIAEARAAGRANGRSADADRLGETRGPLVPRAAQPASRAGTDPRRALADPDVRAALGGTTEIRRSLADPERLAATLAEAEREVAAQRANGRAASAARTERRAAEQPAGEPASASASGSASGSASAEEFEELPALLPGQRILAERELRMDPPAYVPPQRTTRTQTLAVVAENRTTAIAGTLKSPKDQFFSALDDMHAAGDERLHAGDPRLRNEAALEAAERVGHTAAPRTIQRHAAEWERLVNGEDEE